MRFPDVFVPPRARPKEPARPLKAPRDPSVTALLRTVRAQERELAALRTLARGLAEDLTETRALVGGTWNPETPEVEVSS